MHNGAKIFVKLHLERLAVRNNKRSPNQETGLGIELGTSECSERYQIDPKWLKGSLMLNAHLGPIWYHSEPSDVHYSPNQFLALDFFLPFLTARRL